jgi:glycosyltransferase involved in cell wall biosynthesis
LERVSERLSVVIPVWNEEAMIGELLDTIDREVAPRFEEIEIVVVDDGSTDATPAILAGLDGLGGRLRVVRSDHNRGHGPSVLRGLGHTTGEWVFQLDSDGQSVVADFWTLWSRREEADLVLGVRTRRRDPRHRLALSRIVSLVVSVLAGRRLRDPNVPFRLTRRPLLDELVPLMPPDTLAPSILLALGAAVRGWRVTEIPVTHLPRRRGKSSLRSLRLVAFSLRGLGELLGFRYRLLRRTSVA